MKLFVNKFLLIGTLVLLLISIPLTLYFVRQSQDTRSKAAPSSKLSFAPESPNTSTQCSSFTVDVIVDPGQNIVSIVDFYIKYDPAALDVQGIQNNAPAFPTVVRPFAKNAGTASMSVSIGANVTQAIQAPTKVATITFVPKIAGPTQISFDSTKSRIFSLKPADKPTENVLLSGLTPSNVNVKTDACQGNPGVTPGAGTPAIGVTPPGGIPPVGGVTPAAGITPAVGVTPAVGNQSAAICSEFTVAPGSSGPAPFSVLLTAKGNNNLPAGLIAKTTFTFGDGQTQEVTDGMNLKSVTAQTNHTYQAAGIYAASAIFTDEKGATSLACPAQTVNVVAAAPTQAAAPTAALVEKPTGVLVEKPQIPPSGSIGQTIGIIATVMLTVVGGFILLAL